MKILVTGGAGFIGSNFVRYWHKNHPKDEIIIFDLLTYAGHLSSLKDIFKENYEYLKDCPEDRLEEGDEVSLFDDPKVKFVKGDITNAALVKSFMDGVDVVVHYAAESHVDRSIVDPLQFVKTNVLGTAVLLNAALEAKIQRFHHISTDEVYGELGSNDLPFTESTPYSPRTPYSASKAGSDHLVRAYFETYGLPVTITNCANNYGPYHDPEKLIPRFITNLLQGQKVPLMGKGENIREWLHVEDHAEAVDFILQKGQIGETYLIQGEEKANMEITRMILQVLGMDESMIEFVGHRLGHDFRYAINGEKLKALGWERKHNLEADLPKVVEWYKTNEWWWKSLKEGRPNIDRSAQQSYGSTH